MSQVIVKWVHKETPARFYTGNPRPSGLGTTEEQFVPVVPLDALREVVEELKGAKSWLEQLANRIDFEWPNTANQCRIHVRSIERLLASLDAEGVQ